MASVSPDGLTFAASFASSRSSPRGHSRLRRLGHRQPDFAGPPHDPLEERYFPLLFFTLVIPIRRFGEKHWYYSSIAIFILVMLVPWIFWTWSIRDLFAPERTDILIKPFIQSQVIFADLGRFATTIVSTFTEQWSSLIESFVAPGVSRYADSAVADLHLCPALLVLPFVEPTLPSPGGGFSAWVPVRFFSRRYF